VLQKYSIPNKCCSFAMCLNARGTEGWGLLFKGICTETVCWKQSWL